MQGRVQNYSCAGLGLSIPLYSTLHSWCIPVFYKEGFWALAPGRTPGCSPRMPVRPLIRSSTYSFTYAEAPVWTNIVGYSVSMNSTKNKLRQSRRRTELELEQYQENIWSWNSFRVLYLTTLNIRRGLYLSFLIDEDLKASLGPKTKMLVRKPIINPLPAQGETCLNAHYFP
jgi:hypothetical protein